MQGSKEIGELELRGTLQARSVRMLLQRHPGRVTGLKGQGVGRPWQECAGQPRPCETDAR